MAGSLKAIAECDDLSENHEINGLRRRRRVGGRDTMSNAAWRRDVKLLRADMQL